MLACHHNHDQGYPSIGDRPITPVAEGEDERAGRWRGPANQCGIHIRRYTQKQ